MPPSIEASDGYITATENTRALLLCETQGLPTPTVKWFRDGMDVVTSTLPRYRMLRSGSLEISAVRPSDSGNFTCLALNDAGIDEKTVILR